MDTTDPSPGGGRRAPAPAAPPARTGRGLDLVLTAAAGALGLVALTQGALPSPPGAALDAIANEWIIWFLGLYLTLRAAETAAERVRRARRWRVRGVADVHPSHPGSTRGAE
jgi:hypothetical protein